MMMNYLLCDSMRDYKVIEFPFELVHPFRDLTKKQASITFNWFVSAIPERLEILFNAIRSSGHPEIAEKLDYSPESLVPLALWLSIHAHTRKLDPAEYQRNIESVKNPYLRRDAHEITPDWTWTSETISLCFDGGIYLAKVFQSKYENIKWTYVTKPKSDAYLNKPILSGFRMPMSPFDLVHTCVVKMWKKKTGPEELKRIYDIWVTYLT